MTGRERIENDERIEMLRYFSYASWLQVQVFNGYLSVRSVRTAGIPANDCT